MISPLFALFIRALREEARLRFTYLSRATLVFLILIFLIGTQKQLGWMNGPGLRFFATVCYIDLCFVLLAGVGYFAAAISEEKEEMTLGLLRMTNLNPLSILLGKSTSRLWTAALLFAGQFPFTLLAITLGGISLRQIFAAYLTIGSFLFFVSNLALLASVICRRTSGAALLTGLLLLVFLLASPLILWFAQVPVWLGLLPDPNPWTAWMTEFGQGAAAASPFMRIGQVLNLRPFTGILGFQVWSNLGMALACFLLAWLSFEHFCGELKEASPTRAGVTRSRGRGHLLSPGRAWRRALAWKDFYFTAGGKLWVVIKLAIYGAPLVVTRCWPQKLGGPPRWEDFGIGTFWFMILFICVELAFAAATIFRNERQAQTLSSLAMLPQGLSRVAYEKLLGVVPSLAAAGTYLILSVPLLAGPFLRMLINIPPGQDNSEAVLVFFFFVSQGLFFLHLVATLSLYVKRGALPLAIGIEVLIYVVTGVFVSAFSSGDFSVGLLTFLGFAATIFLHFHIGRRLATVAAEG
jgi:hypothetical protein